MAGGNLSPRQKMINMMYLVLTALLALNVSKEVLQSFFEVNKGIERTTINSDLKNEETYFSINVAAENNPKKYKDVSDKASSVKNAVDPIILYIQEMKYDLVNAVDNKIYLGNPKDIFDEDGDPIEGKAIENKKFSELSDIQKHMPIAYLSNKDNRDESGNLFYSKNLGLKKKRASVLKQKIEEYRDLLIDLAGENKALIDNINLVCDVSNKGSGNKLQSWEEYNFVDMPSVGSITILSKIQSDLRHIEADVINYLKRNIDAKSLKFSAAEGIQIPKTNFVLRGDSFRSEIFITANNPDENPEIYVGEIDSLGEGKYEMVGDYETVRIVNGKGIFSRRATSVGNKKWGGLISMKTETGTKFYPFSGEYLVAAKTVVVSPVKMNILYLEVDNPLSCSVPGYTAGEITAVIDNGVISATKKSLGEYSARPAKQGKAIVTLFANADGKRSRMGSMEFRVKEVPPPKAKVDFTKTVKGSMIIGKMELLNAGGVKADLENFDFDGVRYIITSYRFTGIIKGEQTFREVKGGEFSESVRTIIKNTKSGNTITISQIKAKRIDYKTNKETLLDPLILEIK